MSRGGWCGRCGESFTLAEVVAPARPGSCPRCGVAFAPSYTTVLVTALRQLEQAAAALTEAGRQLADVAPLLHVDHRRLGADLAEVLEH